MTFPHTKMDLGNRLSEAIKGHTRGFLAYLAQQPSDILEGKGKLKEAQEDISDETVVDEGHWAPAKKGGNPGSFLLQPSDRDKFINWGKKKAQKKAKKKIQEGIITLKQELETLRPQIAATAQKIYDDWVPNEEGMDEVYGGGGPCDDIASAISSIIADSVDAHVDDGGHEGDDHAFLIVSRAGEQYWVDIPPSIYEQGQGYSWQKIPDVQIKPEDVVIEPV